MRVSKVFRMGRVGVSASRKREGFVSHRAFVSLVALAGTLAGCAAPEPVVTRAPGPAIALRASILAVRMVPASVTQGGAARLLGGTTWPSTPLSEFIVRTEDGRLLSVVQPAEADLSVGSQALLLPGSRPRLTHQL